MFRETVRKRTRTFAGEPRRSWWAWSLGGQVAPCVPKAVARLKRGLWLLSIIGWVGVDAGCSLAGSWRIVSVDPPGMPFPVDTVTFDRNQNYTATRRHEGKTHTSTGQFHWDGFTLDVMQPGTVPRTYGARLRLDGNLVLTNRQGETKAVAILTRTHE